MASSVSSSVSKEFPQVVNQQEKITAPYGSWKSPITADVVSGASKRIGGAAVDGSGRLIWLESRPSESGYRLWLLFYLRFVSNKTLHSFPLSF